MESIMMTAWAYKNKEGNTLVVTNKSVIDGVDDSAFEEVTLLIDDKSLTEAFLELNKTE